MDEALTTSGAQTLGGRKTLPFIIASVVGVGVGAMAMAANLGVYLIDEYNFEPVNSTLFSNIVSGFTSFAPFVAATVFDTCLAVSYFAFITAACVAASLGLLLLALTASLPFLRPLPCSSGACEAPTTLQTAVLCIAIALLIMGAGGTRFSAATMGATQFDDPADQATVFSWYAAGLYVSATIALTAIVYIQESLGWGWGFGLCMAFSMVGLSLFLFGNRYYRHPKPQNSRLMDFLRRIIPSAKRRRIESSEKQCRYDILEDGASELQAGIKCSSVANVAATEQVEEESVGRTVLRLIPLISTGIVHNTLSTVQMDIFFLQALVMDRCIGAHFTFPVGSLGIFIVVASTLSIPLLNRVIYPAWGSIAGSPPTSLQRIGLGMFVGFLAMVYGGVEESRRLEALTSSGEPTSLLWLVPCILIMGLVQAIHYPGLLAFYFQEFPTSLKGSSVAVADLQFGIAAYMSSAVIVLLRRFTGLIRDDANHSRLDLVYWLLAAVAVLNLGCFMLCAKFYRKPQGAET